MYQHAQCIYFLFMIIREVVNVNSLYAMELASSDVETEYFFLNVVADEECLACQQRIEAIVTQSDPQLQAF